MIKKLIIGIGFVVIAIAVVAVMYNLTSKSSGSNKLELTYKSNGGVPYRWEYEIKDKSIVKFVGTKDITPDEYKELEGGPIYTNYIFKGLKKGKTTITVKYVNIVDGSIDKKETITVSVNKNKNIALNAIP